MASPERPDEPCAVQLFFNFIVSPIGKVNNTTLLFQQQRMPYQILVSLCYDGISAHILTSHMFWNKRRYLTKQPMSKNFPSNKTALTK
jgi:hypothetical protein